MQYVNSLHKIENCIYDIKKWMLVNRLKLNDDKTEVTVFAPPSISKSLSVPPLSISSDPIAPQLSCRNLGAHFDQQLSMSSNINMICKSSYFHLRNISSIRSFLDVRTTETIVHAFVTSRIDYCNSLLFGITKQNLLKLQRVQNCAARICLNVF